jgi:hypothetical protein
LAGYIFRRLAAEYRDPKNRVATGLTLFVLARPVTGEATARVASCFSFAGAGSVCMTQPQTAS